MLPGLLNKEISWSAAPPTKSIMGTQPACPPHRGKVPLQGVPMAAAPCHHSKDQPAPTHRGRDRLRRRRQRPSQVRSKTSRARPCEASGALLLSNGGTGGGHAACTLWPPPAPFGYFPARGKYLVRPQADETSHKNWFLVGGREKETSLLSSVSRGFASAEATKGLSARPLETFGALCC